MVSSEGQGSQHILQISWGIRRRLAAEQARQRMLHVSVHTKIVCVVRPLVTRTLQSDTSGRPDATLSPKLGADSVDQAGDVACQCRQEHFNFNF